MVMFPEWLQWWWGVPYGSLPRLPAHLSAFQSNPFCSTGLGQGQAPWGPCTWPQLRLCLHSKVSTWAAGHMASQGAGQPLSPGSTPDGTSYGPSLVSVFPLG